MKPSYKITSEKKGQLETELQDLVQVKRPDILVRLDAARALGDLKENAEYHSMRDLQGKNEARIREIEELLKYADIIEKNNSGIVCLASEVTVQKGGAGDKRIFTLVSAAEADILSNKIGEDSPIGAALKGKSVGEIAQVETRKGIIEYTILAIN